MAATQPKFDAFHVRIKCTSNKPGEPQSVTIRIARQKTWYDDQADEPGTARLNESE